MHRWFSLFLVLVFMGAAGCTGEAPPPNTPPPSNTPPATNPPSNNPPPAPPPADVAHCSEAPTKAESRAGYIAVFYTCAGEPVPSRPRAILRQVPSGSTGVETALRELVKGPTEEEKAKGFQSFFSSETAQILKSVTVSEAGRAVVDFHDLRHKMNNASTSAGSVQLIRELSQTVFQFEEIKAVEYRFEGSCTAFFEWLQGECQVISAANYR